MAAAATAAPMNGVIEISGPERVRMNELVARYLKAMGDARNVEGDPDARYFGTKLEDGALVSDGNPRLGHIAFEQWFATSARK
jgi:uncharacterized protein YbjT (DUF2867 family)